LQNPTHYECSVVKRPMSLCAIRVNEERGNGEDTGVYATGTRFGPLLRFDMTNRTEDGFCVGLTNPTIFGSKPKFFFSTQERSRGSREEEESVRRHPQGVMKRWRNMKR
jgi:hypothetical protein